MRHATGVRTALAAALVLSAAACGSTEESEFASALNVDLEEMTRSGTGLYVRDLVEGEGQAAEAGDVVVVHYTGWLTDGTKFDSSLDGGEPLVIPIGTGRVIPGWDEGVPGMAVGGRRQLVIPPDLAYGERGAGGVIPPGATLVFEIELVEIR